MAPGNLTISDSSSRQGLSCYLDVGRHDTRIDNITSISDVEGSEPPLLHPRHSYETNIFSPRKRFVSKRFLCNIWQSRHSTPDISMIRRQKTLISSLENWTGRYVRLSFETYSSTRSLFLIIYYPELTIEYFNVSYSFLCIKIHGETCIHYRWYGREKRNGQ